MTIVAGIADAGTTGTMPPATFFGGLPLASGWLPQLPPQQQQLQQVVTCFYGADLAFPHQSGGGALLRRRRRGEERGGEEITCEA